MHICVFCAASDVDEKYVRAAAELGRFIGERGHALVWGGSDKGLMKVVADHVQQFGGKLYGVSVEHLKGHARLNADEMHIAQDIGERKALMLKRADALVMLIGGIGSLDEVTDVLEQKKHKLHDKPIIVLNTDGFYDGLKQQLERIEREGFLLSGGNTRSLDELIVFAEMPEDAMRHIEERAKR